MKSLSYSFEHYSGKICGYITYRTYIYWLVTATSSNKFVPNYTTYLLGVHRCSFLGILKNILCENLDNRCSYSNYFLKVKATVSMAELNRVRYDNPPVSLRNIY